VTEPARIYMTLTLSHFRCYRLKSIELLFFSGRLSPRRGRLALENRRSARGVVLRTTPGARQRAGGAPWRSTMVERCGPAGGACGTHAS
jgi:hypothetical protein